VCIKDERMRGNPVMTIPIKKRTTTELFIDRTAAQYTGELRPIMLINQLALADWRSENIFVEVLS